MLTTARIKEIASLIHRKYRRRLGQTIVEGTRAVSAALDSGASLVEVIVTSDAGADDDVRSILDRVNVPVHEVDNRSMRRLTDVTSPPGIMAIVKIALDQRFDPKGATRILALDTVQDPGNVGSLIRSAAWFGIPNVVLGPGCADPFAPKVIRATMGAIWDVAVSESPDLVVSLKAVRTSGFRVAAAALGGISATAWHPAEPTVLVLGNEANGIGQALLEQADVRVSILPTGRPVATDSLNVATAGAILMYQWSR